MSDDLLLRATRALREQRDGTIDDARAAEDRLIARLPRARRIRPTSPWGLSMAALLIGSTVWATAGAPLPSWLDGSSSDVPPAAPPTPPSAAEHASPGKERDSSRPVGPAPTDPMPPAASPTLPAKSPEPRPLARADGHEPSNPNEPNEPSNPNEPTALRPSEPNEPTALRPNEPPAPEASESSSQKAALDLYQKAHELHFVARDYARALAAWDRYLQLAPTGSLALEARFHRAICLTRLGQRDAALAALAPFLRGDYGTYRQAQAEQLRQQLPPR